MKFTLELEQDFSDKKLPTLDLSMWLKDNGPQSSPNIEFEFFSKEMGSKYCILEKSSMDYSSKVSILSNDLCRRLLNTRESIAQSRKDQIVDEYALKMLRSGYSLSQVRFIIVSGIRSFKRKVAHAKESGTKLHRSAKSSLTDRIKKKILEKTSWFKSKGGQKKTASFSKNIKRKNTKSSSKSLRVKSVLFVPRSNSSKLCKMLRAEEQKLASITGYRVAIKERNGLQLRRILCVKNPFGNMFCGRQNCMVCKEGGKGDCRRRNICYQTTCDNCRERNAKNGIPDTPENVALYTGEAFRSPVERSQEHCRDYLAKKEDSHIWKHKTLEHPDEEVTFTMKVIKKHHSSFREWSWKQLSLLRLNSRDTTSSTAKVASTDV